MLSPAGAAGTTRPGPATTRRTRGVALAGAVIVAVTAIAVADPPAASAATPDTNATYVFVNRHSGKAMDVYNWSTADNAPINQFTRNNLAVQQWRFVSVGSGYYQVRSVHSGKVMEVPNANDGVQLVQNAAASGNTRQHFRLADSDSGYVRFINRHSNKVLDLWAWSTADGAMISQYSDLNGWNQQWQLAIVGGGTPQPQPGAWPTPTGQSAVDGTIPVSGVFDGGMRRYCCIGDGSQEESQDPMFRLAAGATLQNVIIGAPAGDGVHCEGACTLRNVWWEDVGEDAATFRGSGSPAFLVDGGGARSASDKVFQHNGAGTLTIQNFQATNFGTFYRSCGNCSTQNRRNVVIRNVTLTRPGNTVAGINTNYGDTARFTAVTIVNDASRAMVICRKYTGNDDGDEPVQVGTGADGTNCIYSPSDLIYR
jgi:hypothetical protein